MQTAGAALAVVPIIIVVLMLQRSFVQDIALTRMKDQASVEQATIRAYRPDDEPEIVRIWNAALFADPINVTTWRAKVLLDPNFDPEGCHVAEIENQLADFLLCLVRRVPFFVVGCERG